MTLLDAKDLSFSYPLTGDNGIINNLNLQVSRGEFLCLLGPSGCGKSTLLKLLAGFLIPQKGRICHDSHEIRAPYIQGQMIFQDPGQLLPWLTVEENILFSEKKGTLFMKKSPGDRDRLKEILSLTGLNKFSSYYPCQLSGGMKQRCALGRALYAEPDILFLDEPFVSLDAPSRWGLQNLLLSIWEKKETTVIFVTHDIREALILSERLLLFSRPGERITEQKNTLARPRNGLSESFLREEGRLYSLMESFSFTR